MSEVMKRRSRSPRSRAMDRVMVIELIRSNLEKDRSRLAEKKEEARREKEEGWEPPRRCVGWVTEEEANKDVDGRQRMRPEHIRTLEGVVSYREELLKTKMQEHFDDPFIQKGRKENFARSAMDPEDPCHRATGGSIPAVGP